MGLAIGIELDTCPNYVTFSLSFNKNSLSIYCVLDIIMVLETDSEQQCLCPRKACVFIWRDSEQINMKYDTYVYSNIIYSSQKVEATQVSFDE